MNEEIPCKIGTIPMVIFAIDRRTPVEVGRIIRIRRQRGAAWERVKVTSVGLPARGFFTGDLF